MKEMLLNLDTPELFKLYEKNQKGLYNVIFKQIGKAS